MIRFTSWKHTPTLSTNPLSYTKKKRPNGLWLIWLLQRHDLWFIFPGKNKTEPFV